MPIRDRDIRVALRQLIDTAYRNDSDTLIVEEMGLCEGDARIDLAVINGSMTGYEIKSEADTLQRLPHQVEIYGRLLDEISVISSSCHLVKVSKIVPDWWGLFEAVETDGIVNVHVARKPRKNPSIDSRAVVRLLWKDEALSLLTRLGHGKGMRSKARAQVWERLCEIVSERELGELVRQQLKARRNWRAVVEQASDDGLFPPSSTSSNYLVA